MTKSLARELGRSGIRVNAVAPGVTRTDMVAALPSEIVERISAPIPLGRIGEPEEVANVFLFLASDISSYVTGTVISVDGARVIKKLFPLFLETFHHVYLFQLPRGKRKGQDVGCRYENGADQKRFSGQQN